jgi:hypothetical protein
MTHHLLKTYEEVDILNIRRFLPGKETSIQLDRKLINLQGRFGNKDEKKTSLIAGNRQLVT